MRERLDDKVDRLLGAYLATRGFALTDKTDEQTSSWYSDVQFESSQIRLKIAVERSEELISIASKHTTAGSGVPIERLVNLLNGTNGFGLAGLTLEKQAELLISYGDKLLQPGLAESAAFKSWCRMVFDQWCESIRPGRSKPAG